MILYEPRSRISDFAFSVFAEASLTGAGATFPAPV
ncbi:hypothetical protein ACUN9W_09490, partial [Escherichia coli]